MKYFFPVPFTDQNGPHSLRDLLTNRYFVVITAALLYFALDAPITIAAFVLEMTDHEKPWYTFLKISSFTLWFFMVIYFAVRVSF